MDIGSIADANPLVLLIYAVILIATGGVGVAIVNAVVATRRGIKGDALVKEQNSIEGFTNLTAGQGVFIENLQKQVKSLEDQVTAIRAEFSAQLGIMEAKLSAEVDYSNSLIRTLSEHTIPIPPRPRKN